VWIKHLMPLALLAAMALGCTSQPTPSVVPTPTNPVSSATATRTLAASQGNVTASPHPSPPLIEATNVHSLVLADSLAVDSAGGLSWAPDGAAFAFSGSIDGVDGIYYYEPPTKDWKLIDSVISMYPVAFSSDASLLSSSGLSLAIWSVSDLKPLLRIEDTGVDCALVFIPGTHNVLRACLTTGVDPFMTQLVEWDWQSNHLRSVCEPQGIFRTLAINHAGDKAILALGRIGTNLEDRISVVDISSGQELCQFVGFDFALASQADQIAVIPQQGPIRHYALAGCAEIASPTGIAGESLPVPMDVTPDGGVLFTTGLESSVFRATGIAAQQVLYESENSTGQIVSISVSPDGRRVAIIRLTTWNSGAVEIWTAVAN
jgi:hypothetical protein